MNVVGTVDSLWRYPIKSMAGEALPEAFVDYAGVRRPDFCLPEFGGS